LNAKLEVERILIIKGSGRENINGRERRRKPPNLTLSEAEEVNGGCFVTMP
jgi:hypothetical protein